MRKLMMLLLVMFAWAVNDVQAQGCDYSALCPTDADRYLASTAWSDGCGPNQGGHSLVIKNMFVNGSSKLEFVAGQSYFDVSASGARLHGVLEVTGNGGAYMGTRWLLDLPLSEFQGASPKLELNNSCSAQQNAAVPNWTYYTIDAAAAGHHLVRITDAQGGCDQSGSADYIDFTDASPIYKGQFGMTANGKNASLGFSHWFNYTGTVGGNPVSGPSGSQGGDFNIDITPRPCFNINPCPNTEYGFFYVSNAIGAGGALGEVFTVSLDGGDANMTPLASLGHKAHIAYDQTNEILYAIDNSTVDRFTTINVNDGTIGAYVNITGVNLGTDAPTLEFNEADGFLYVGSATNNEIYKVDPVTGVATSFSTAPVEGGDIAFLPNGDLLLATRDGDRLIRVNAGATGNDVINSLPANVNGMALTLMGGLFTASSGSTSFNAHDDAGNLIGSYAAKLGGATYTFENGDLTAGCLPDDDGGRIITPPCETLATYYARINNNGGANENTDIYSVEFSGDSANLTFVTNVSYGAHLALNEKGGLLWIVNDNNGDVQSYNPYLDSFGPVVATGIGSGTHQAAFKDSVTMYIGSTNTDDAYEFNIVTNAVSTVGSAPDLAGGDFEVTGSGDLIAAINGLDIIYNITGGSTVGPIVGGVVGMSTLGNGRVIIAPRDSSAFFIYTMAGAVAEGTYNAYLNGAPFTLAVGDLAAACVREPDNSITIDPCVDGQDIYFSKIINGSPRTTEIRRVVLGTDAAIDDLIATVPYAAHQALNTDDGLIYLVNEDNGQIQALNPTNGAFGPVIDAGINEKVPAVAYAGFGLLYLGAEASDKIYQVDVVAGTATQVGTAPVGGGDLALSQTGQLFLATRETDEILLLDLLGGTNSVITSIPPLVTGLAITEAGNLLVSNASSSEFTEVATNGSTVATYTVKIGGTTQSLSSADLSSGCGAADPGRRILTPPCDELETYYAKIYNPTNHPTDRYTELYSVEISADTAKMTYLNRVEYGAHLALNAKTGMLWLVDQSFLDLQPYNPVTNSFGPKVSTGLAGKVTTAAFKDSVTIVLGNSSTNKYYEYNFSTSTATLIGSADVEGGDFEFAGNGDLLMATNAGDNLVNVTTNTVLSSIPANVTGMSTLGNGNVIISNRNANVFTILRMSDGANQGEYLAFEGSTPFTLSDGDLASACVSPDGNREVELCQNLRYFHTYNYDGLGGQRLTNLYGIDFVGGNAEMTPLVVGIPDAHHTAYNEATDLVYLVRNTNPSAYRTYDPATGILSGYTMLPSITSVTAAVFEDDSTLVIGNPSNNKVYDVNINDGSVTFRTNAPIGGGDLFFDNAGNLLAATRDGDKVVDITGGNVDLFNIANKVNGAVGSPNNDFVYTAHFNTTEIKTYALADGTPGASFPATVGGSPFTFLDGDLTAGCYEGPWREYCPTYNFFYTDNVPGAGAGGAPLSQLFAVQLDELTGQANMTFLQAFNFDAHIALNPANNLIYVVDFHAPSFTTYDPATGTVGATVAINGPAQFPVAAFGPDGKFYIANQADNKLYTVDLATGDLTFVVDVPFVHGGDLTFNAFGDAILVTRDNGGASYKLDLIGGAHTLIDSGLSADVNGVATDQFGNLLYSNKGDNTFDVLNPDGTVEGSSFVATLDGTPYPAFTFGDMTYGCVEIVPTRMSTLTVEDAVDCTPNPRARKIKLTNNSGMDLANVELKATSPTNSNKKFKRRKGLLRAGQEWNVWYNAWRFGDTVQVYVDGTLFTDYVVSEEPNICPVAIAPTIAEECSRKPNRYRWSVENTNAERIFVWFEDEDKNGNTIERQFRIMPGTTGYIYTRVNAVDFKYQGLTQVETISVAAAGQYPAICPLDQPLVITSLCSEKSKANKWKVTNPNPYAVRLLLVRTHTTKERWIHVPAADKGGMRTFYTNIRNLGNTITLKYDRNGTSPDLTATLNPAACDQPLNVVCPSDPNVVRYEIGTYENDGCKGGSHSIWLPKLFNNANAEFHFLNNDSYKSYLDVNYATMTATLTGYAEVDNGPGSTTPHDTAYNFAGTVWAVNISFDAGTHTPKFENNACGNQSGHLPNWKFFTLLPASPVQPHMVRITDENGAPGAYSTDVVNFTHMYGANNYGFQMGTAANGKNKNYGVSGWFFYDSHIDPTGLARSSDEYNDDGKGDINADLDVICVNGQWVNIECERPMDGSCYATDYTYTEGTTFNGGALAANRTDGSQATGEPEDDDTYNFVTIGYGGELILEFDGAISNATGDDIAITETSFGNQSCATYNEKVKVYVSQCKEDWVEVGTVCLDGSVDLDDAGAEGLEWARYVKLINDGSTTSDGYDVDGVQALNNACVNTIIIDPRVVAFANPFVNDINIDLGTGVNFTNVEWYIYEYANLVQSGTVSNVSEQFTIANIGPLLTPAPSNILGQYILKIKADGEWLKSIIIVKDR